MTEPNVDSLVIAYMNVTNLGGSWLDSRNYSKYVYYILANNNNNIIENCKNDHTCMHTWKSGYSHQILKQVTYY